MSRMSLQARMRSWLGCSRSLCTANQNACATPTPLVRPPTHSVLQAECVGTFLDPDTGATLARVWSNTWLNFNNVGGLTGKLPMGQGSAVLRSGKDAWGAGLPDAHRAGACC